MAKQNIFDNERLVILFDFYIPVLYTNYISTEDSLNKE